MFSSQFRMPIFRRFVAAVAAALTVLTAGAGVALAATATRTLGSGTVDAWGWWAPRSTSVGFRTSDQLSGPVTLTLTWPERAALRVSLYDGSGRRVAGSSATTSPASLSANLNRSTRYTARVTADSGMSSWRLSLTETVGEAAPPPSPSGARVTVAFTFDDGTADQRTAAQILEQRGMRATFYVITDKVGRSGYLNRDDLTRLASRGHEIGSHTVTHRDLTSLGSSDAQREICSSRTTLAGWGLNVKTLAYPFGANTAAIRQMVADCGYTSARAVGGFDSPVCTGCQTAEPLPLTSSSRYRVRTVSSIRNDTSLDEMKRIVTNAEATGGLVELVLHNVCSGTCGTYSTTPERLSAFADWLAGRASSGTVVRTAGGATS